MVSAVDAPGAILRISGSGVFHNSQPATGSAALYRDDVVQTSKATAARIESRGSAVDIHEDTLVQFEGDELVLEHGVLSVNTSTGLKVRVGCVMIVPVDGSSWTRYDVSDVNGKVTVSALKSDTYIDHRSSGAKPAKKSSGSERVIVREGEQQSREDKCGGGYVNESAATAAHGPILNSPWAKLAGGVAVGVVTCLGLCHDDDPISPNHP
jgi:hypothetical protein